MKIVIAVAIVLIPVIGWLILSGAVYTVEEGQQAVITQFGEIVGDPVTTPGRKLKLPLIQRVRFLEKGLIEWRGEPVEMLTGDKIFVRLAATVQWEITDPVTYFKRLRMRRSADSRIEDIVHGEMRQAVSGLAWAALAESGDRCFAVADETTPSGLGRVARSVLERTGERIADCGIVIDSACIEPAHQPGDASAGKLGPESG